MTHGSGSIGLIAGNRSLPLVFAAQARLQGISRIVAVAFENETNVRLASLVDELTWLKVGQLGKMIEFFKSRDIRQCVMLGQIAPRNLFDLRPDLRAMALLLRLKEKNAHTIFGAIAEELRKDGIELVEASPWLKSLMPGAGFRIGPAPTDRQREDIDYGFRMAKAVSRLEIGQMVVTKNGVVLAVEAFEGTDRCLARGGELAGKGGQAVAVKVAKEHHDMRFDIPCIGPDTVKTCANVGISVLAVEADKTLLLELETVRKLAREEKVCVITVSGAEAGASK